MNRPLPLVLLGLWLGFLVASWALAGASFRTADRSKTNRDIASRLAPLEEGDKALVLRSVAAELNRWMFRARSTAELVLGCALLFLVWTSPGASKLLVGLALALTLVQAFGLSPAIAELGRSLDFVRRPLAPEIARRFGLLHGGYVLLDLAKGILLVLFGWAFAHPPR